VVNNNTENLIKVTSSQAC